LSINTDASKDKSPLKGTDGQRTTTNRTGAYGTTSKIGGGPSDASRFIKQPTTSTNAKAAAERRQTIT